jgi:glycerol-3-phosphate O-acyltransferase
VWFLLLCSTWILFVLNTLQHMPATDLQDLLLVAVNLKQSQPVQRILQHMQQHKLLLYADSSCTSDNSSSSSVQLVEHMITTALARGHWEVAPIRQQHSSWGCRQ